MKCGAKTFWSIGISAKVKMVNILVNVSVLSVSFYVVELIRNGSVGKSKMSEKFAQSDSKILVNE